MKNSIQRKRTLVIIFGILQSPQTPSVQKGKILNDFLEDKYSPLFIQEWQTIANSFKTPKVQNRIMRHIHNDWAHVLGKDKIIINGGLREFVSKVHSSVFL